MPHSVLDEEDLARVGRVIHSGVNSVERKPFRPWLLLSFIWAMMFALGGISYTIGLLYGLV